ncbi:hypothetical protein D3C71_1854800 [compost metagenome]
MQRRVKDFIDGRQLDNLAEIHHRHAVAHMANDRKAVSDNHHCQPQLMFQAFEQVHYLRLHGDIQRGNRLIAQQQFWPGG